MNDIMILINQPGSNVHCLNPRMQTFLLQEEQVIQTKVKATDSKFLVVYLCKVKVKYGK